MRNDTIGTKALIEVKNLSFAYEDKMVINNINLSIASNEKIAVVGPNGAGKSTFFLNLNGYDMFLQWLSIHLLHSNTFLQYIISYHF